MAKPIPKGYHTLTSCFTFKDTRKAIEFYKNAFSAQALDIFPALQGEGIMHATMRIGDSIIMMGDESPGEKSPKSAETIGSCPTSFFLYVPDADAAFRQALGAGAVEVMPVMDMFWGDRCGTLKDPFGYTWMVATHKKDLTQDEIREGAKEFFAKMAKC